MNIQKSKNLRNHDGVLTAGIVGLCDVYHICTSALSVDGVDVLGLTVKLLAMTFKSVFVEMLYTVPLIYKDLSQLILYMFRVIFERCMTSQQCFDLQNI